MSHIASVDCYVTDLSIARTVGDRLGFNLLENVKTFNSYYPDQKCEHKFALKDAKTTGSYDRDYEIGLVKRTDGVAGWSLWFDNFGRPGQRLQAKAGPGLETLKNELAAEAALRALQRQGYRVNRTVAADGEIQLVAQR